MNRLLQRGKLLIESDYDSKHDRKIWICAIFILFSAMLYLNYLQPIFNDDWIYSFKIEEGFPEKKDPAHIESFADFVSSQITHYQIWGGRTVAHIIVQGLLIMDAPFRIILNSLAFVFLIWATVRIATPAQRKGRLYIVTFLMFWLLQPGFAASVLWITGSGNYLWTTMFILFFLHPFCKSYLDNNYKQKNIFYSMLLLLAGFTAGWTNENIAISLSLAAIAYLVYLKKQRIKIPLWVWLGIAGLLIGTLLLIFAPGNKVRMESELILKKIDTSSYILYILKGVKGIFVSMFLNGLPTVLLYVLIFTTYCFCRKGNSNPRKLHLSLFFFTVALIALFAMSASPAFPTRAWFGIIAFMIIASVLLYTEIDFSKFLPIRVYDNILILFFFVLFLGQYNLAAKDLRHIKKIFAERETIVNIEKQKGNKDIVFHNRLILETTFPHTSDLEASPGCWKNELYSVYHDLHSVKVAPEESDGDNKNE